MMKKCAAVLLLCMTLAGCASAFMSFDQSAYARMPWARKSFEESKSICRYDSLSKKSWNINDVHIMEFKACMDKKGWRYRSETFY